MVTENFHQAVYILSFWFKSVFNYLLSNSTTWTEKPNVKFLRSTRVRCLKNDDAINPFASNKFAAPKHTLWCNSSNFLLTTWLSRAKTYHKAVYKSNTSRLSDPNENIMLQSSGMRRKQNFALANPPLLSLFLSLFSFLWWALKRLHLDKKHFWESFSGLQITWKEI